MPWGRVLRGWVSQGRVLRVGTWGHVLRGGCLWGGPEGQVPRGFVPEGGGVPRWLGAKGQVMLQAPAGPTVEPSGRVGPAVPGHQGCVWDPRVPGGPRALDRAAPAHAGPQWPGPCVALLGVACSASERSIYFYASTGGGAPPSTLSKVRGPGLGVAESAFRPGCLACLWGRGAGFAGC